MDHRLRRRTPSGNAWPYQLARASWLGPIGFVVLNLFFLRHMDAGSVYPPIRDVLGGIAYLICPWFGVIALLGVPKYGWRKILIPSLFGMGMGLVVYSMIYDGYMEGRKTPLEKAILRNVEAAEEDLPRQLDAETELSDIVADGTQIKYRYQIDRNPSDAPPFSEMGPVIERRLRDGFCGPDTAAELRDPEVTTVHTYHLSDGEVYGRVMLRGDICDEPVKQASIEELRDIVELNARVVGQDLPTQLDEWTELTDIIPDGTRLIHELDLRLLPHERMPRAEFERAVEQGLQMEFCQPSPEEDPRLRHPLFVAVFRYYVDDELYGEVEVLGDSCPSDAELFIPADEPMDEPTESTSL